MASRYFINECKNFANMNRYGKLEFASPTLELNQSNKIQNFTIDSGCIVDNDIIGSVYVKKLEADLVDAVSDEIENRQFRASVGVKVHEQYDEPFEIEGTTSQETTTGTQLANITDYTKTSYGVNVSCVKNEFVLDGTVSTPSSIIGFPQTSSQRVFFATLPAGTYSFCYSKISGSISYDSGASAIYIRNSANAEVTAMLITKNTTNQVVVFTLSQETTLYFQYYVNKAGWKFENYDFQVILASGRYTASTIPPFEKYTGGIPAPNVDFPQPIVNKTGTIMEIINNEEYYFHLGDMELCEVNNNKDKIYKNDDVWYKHKVIEKIESYDGETIETDYMSTTGQLSTGATVYYVLDTPVDIEITDTTLLHELNTVGVPLEYISLGDFVVEKPTDEQFENLSSLVAYDTLIKRINDTYSTNLDYENETITIGDIYAELCGSMELTPVTTTFTNSTITVGSNPFTNNEKNRDVLTSIAKVACAFVDIDNETDEIDLKWFNNNIDYTFEPSDYSSLEGGKTIFGPINSLVIRSSFSESENVSYQDDESVQEIGEHQITVVEDYFLYNSEKRQEALMNIWAKVNGLTYTECTLTTYTGKPFIKAGNKIRIYTDEENYIDTYVLENLFTFDGSFKSVLKSPALTEQEIKTKQDVSLREKLKNTEITVNKQDKTIKALVEQTDENTSNISTLQINVNGISSNVSSFEQVTNEQLSSLSGNLSSYKEITDNELETINNKFGNLATTDDISGIAHSVEVLQSDTYTKTQINTMMTDGTVKKLSTTSMTVDENGLTFEKTNAKAKTNINQDGMTILDNNDQPIMRAVYDDDVGNTVVETYRHQVHEYFIMGQHSRFEDFEDGTGCFFINGNG